MTESEIIASSVDGFVRVFDLRMQKQLKFEFPSPINSFDIGLDPNFVSVSTLDSTVTLLDISDGQIISEYKDNHESS